MVEKTCKPTRKWINQLCLDLLI